VDFGRIYKEFNIKSNKKLNLNSFKNNLAKRLFTLNKILKTRFKGAFITIYKFKKTFITIYKFKKVFITIYKFKKISIIACKVFKYFNIKKLL